jgi:hypothetical protein
LYDCVYVAQPFTDRYGLIIKKKTPENQVKKSSIFGNDSSEEEVDKG